MGSFIHRHQDFLQVSKIHYPYFKFLQKEAQTGEEICIRLSLSLKH